jgi:hypothetical protein
MERGRPQLSQAAPLLIQNESTSPASSDVNSEKCDCFLLFSAQPVCNLSQLCARRLDSISDGSGNLGGGLRLLFRLTS